MKREGSRLDKGVSSLAGFDSSSHAATPEISSLNRKFTKSPLSSSRRKGRCVDRSSP
jgi:hypothetical protein